MNEEYTFPCGCKFKKIHNTIFPSVKFDPNIKKMPLDCPRTWNIFHRGDTKGIFQLESRLGSSLSKKLKPSNIEELAALISIMRPGSLAAMQDGKSVTDRYIDRKNGEEAVSYMHPALEPALKMTKGLMIYQENAMQVAKDVAGFSLQQADILRKCVAKGSLVYTSCGQVKIEDIDIKDKKYDILTVDDSGNTIYKPIKRVWSTGEQVVYKLKTESGASIKTTANHQIYTTRGWLPLSDITIEDSVIVNIDFNIPLLERFYTAWNSIISIEKDVICTTYDYEIDDKDIHYGFINGILVHNSIGKKDTELMTKVKTEFLDGCKMEGIIDDETANAIFNLIEKSQKYSFNKSHAVSYAYNSYLSAYTKAHFPKLFFTSWLWYAKAKQKPLDEIKELINNARLNNVKMATIDFRNRNTHFKFIDGIVYFGTTDIKGIGESSIGAMEHAVKMTERQLHKTCEEFSWTEFLLFVTPSLNTTCAKALITCGAVDYMNIPRTEMLFQYNILSNLNQKELMWIQDKYFTSPLIFVELLNLIVSAPPGRKPGSGCSNKNRQTKLRGWHNELCNPPYKLIDSPAWIESVERELMGIAMTCNSLDKTSILSANFSCRDFIDNKKCTGPIILAGTLLDTRIIKTKRGKTPGQQMAFGNIEDMTGSISIVIFPDAYKEYKHCVYDDNQVLVMGKSSKDSDSLVVETIMEI